MGIEGLLNKSFRQHASGHDVVSLGKCMDYNHNPRYAVFDFNSSTGNSKTRVVAFKGTSTTVDIFVDATLWSVVKVLQSLSVVIPVINAFPADQVQWMIAKFRMRAMVKQEQAVWKAIAKNISELCHVDWPCVLTGHSLGGGIAQVVAGYLAL